MEKASHDLMNEHMAILLALDILEKMTDAVKSNVDMEYKDFIDMVEFLKLFADKCHHGKEEDFLFPALEEAGILRQNGPIGVMLAEHEQGRKFIRQMQDSLSNNTIQREDFANSATAYINLLRNHINKENNVLFPMGDAKLSYEKQKELLERFERFEEEVIGKGKHEELHSMLEIFKKKYLN